MTTKARNELLDAVIEYAGRSGVAHASLRQIATAIGTSHRMLIHHFGSKEDMLVAVVREVERRQRAAVAAASQDGPGGGAREPWATWEQLTDPALAPYERLFFELYGQALVGQEWAKPMLDGVVDDWLETVAAVTGEANARLAIAVTRGLLLDLLATGDKEAVDDAMRTFMRQYADSGGSG